MHKKLNEMEQLIFLPSNMYEFNQKLERYSRCIIRIADKYSNVAGSGFLGYFQPNGSSEEGLYIVFTAYHVLKTDDIDNISKCLLSFQENVKLGTINMSKKFIKCVWSDSNLDAIAIVINTYVAAHWMRLGASFLDIATPFVGMTIGIPEITIFSDFKIQGIKTGTVVALVESPFLTHNCYSVQGSSGSPLINLEGCAIGIHIGVAGERIFNEKLAIILESFLRIQIVEHEKRQLILFAPSFNIINDESKNLQSYNNDETKRLGQGTHPIIRVKPIDRENNVHPIIQ